MKIYHDPLQKDAFTVHMNERWFSINAEGEVRRVQYGDLSKIPENMHPDHTEAHLVPVRVVESIVVIAEFFAEFTWGPDGFDAFDPRLAWAR